MRLSTEETLKQLLEKEELFVLYSAAVGTDKSSGENKPKLEYKNPMLFEAPGSKIVQAWVYDTREACTSAAQAFAQQRIPAICIRYEKNGLRTMYLCLAEMGVQRILFHTGEDQGEVPMAAEEIQNIINVPDRSEAEADLSRDIQFYWQRANQNRVTPEGKVSVMAKEDENIRFACMTGSLMRSTLYIPVIVDKENKNRISLPVYMDKDAEGNIKDRQVLAFSNKMEVNRFFTEKTPTISLFKLSQIEQFLGDHADCVVINKGTTALRITKPLISKIIANEKLIAEGAPLTKEAMEVHLRYDRVFYSLYGGTMLQPKAGQKPQVLLRGPYIVEDQETFDDTYCIYESKEEAQAAAKKILEEKKLFVVVREWRNIEFANLYTLLASKAVNLIIYKKGEETVSMDLSEIVKLPDFSNIEEKQRPIVNPTLALSAQYYWQEIARMVKIEDRDEEDQELLAEKNAEFLANLKKATFYIRFDQQEKDGQKVIVFPLDTRRDAEGKIISAEYQLFTDIYEVQDFFNAAPPTITKITYAQLKQLIIPECTGFAFNPAGVDLHYSKDKMEKILNSL
ncbi:MAG: hypothetical protein KBT01_09895 [Clostridiales bacterium]|nr:hypothetical protein [Candidatus Blautia equi]